MGIIKKRRAERGSITLEAAVAFPVFFCVVIAIAFLLRAVQVHELVQNAISQAALEIAGNSYAYGATGELDIRRDASATTAAGGASAPAAAAAVWAGSAEDVIIKAAQLGNWLPADISNEASEQFINASAALKDHTNAVLFSRYTSLVTSKYMNENAGALRGLDFTGSAILADGSDEVEVAVDYSFKIPIPIAQLSRLAMNQKAYARAWFFGAGANAGLDDPYKNEDDIWSLGNFERGKRIQEIFHANLPETFPIIASFSDGVATAIHSLDTTAATYQSAAGIRRKIEEYIKIMKDYQGQDKPYGSENIVIKPEDITARRIVLVIPRNDISPEVSSEIDRCIREALEQGIILQVERYAKKLV